MLTKMRAKNFKAWKDTGDIRLAPITGFFGTNSSGKSSLLQMLLLLKQTAQVSDNRLVLYLGGNDSSVYLGSFRDVVFKHDVLNLFEFSLEWDNTINEVSYMFGEPIGFTSSVKLESEQLVVDRLRYYGPSGTTIVGMNLDPSTKTHVLENPSNYDVVYTWDGLVGGRLAPSKYYQIPYFDLRTDLFYGSIGTILEACAERMLYLGPLREYPKRTYVSTGISPSDVGMRGERTIDALIGAQLSADNRQVQEKVGEWLNATGLIHSFHLRPIAPGRRDYEIVIKQTPSSTEVLITDIGFGIAQVLPVITLCYYAEPGSTLILEQPEIHLHPSAQAALADLFIEVAQTRNIQFIIESHSEYLLHRLQRRIAEEKIAAEDVALYFCHMGDEAAEIEPLRLDEYGNIANWPQNFFGDTTGDLVAMAEAEMQRKMAAAQ